ncbi:SufE family protein [Hyphomicrobium sp.]|uniref:SufE family protein n=1 Tax=Hyphomicrobium sp. TaxID=82 RepID=UPI002E32FABD|nr:SufE family protein [Hyphomicrobium sp.]HEX2843336.1 SufE family protein [Hyphomicrobium sp.]
MTIANLQSDFELLDDWEDRYRYIIELGRTLAPFPDALRTEATKVRGCASQVWLVSEVRPADNGSGPMLHFVGDSDAHIVRGLIAILFSLYNDKPAREILAIEPQTAFAALGLKEHLTPQRSNGLASMVERIRADATAALA